MKKFNLLITFLILFGTFLNLQSQNKFSNRKINNLKNQVSQLVEEDKNIRFLVLASSANNEEPGPLIKALTGKKIKDLSIPMVIIPGSLSEKEIDLIA